jgi:hypothetical protein
MNWKGFERKMCYSNWGDMLLIVWRDWVKPWGNLAIAGVAVQIRTVNSRYMKSRVLQECRTVRGLCREEAGLWVTNEVFQGCPSAYHLAAALCFRLLPWSLSSHYKIYIYIIDICRSGRSTVPRYLPLRFGEVSIDTAGVLIPGRGNRFFSTPQRPDWFWDPPSKLSNA